MSPGLTPFFLALALTGPALAQEPTPVPAEAAATLAAPAASAAPVPDSPAVAPLCSICVRVTAVQTETRPGKPTGAGAATGAMVGGVIGRQMGDGELWVTSAGVLAGGLIGREIEKHMKRQTVWVTTVVGRDGKAQNYETLADPGFKPGDVVRIQDGRLVTLTPSLPSPA